MPEARLERTRQGYDGYVYDPPATWCRCGRNKHIHSRQFDLDELIAEGARNLAAAVDARVMAIAYTQSVDDID